MPAGRPLVEVGAAGIGPLMRRQLRAALLTGGSVCGALTLLPLLITLVPVVGSVRLWGIPLPWVLLGVAVYPVLVAAAACYVRFAERNERTFAERFGRS